VGVPGRAVSSMATLPGTPGPKVKAIKPASPKTKTQVGNTLRLEGITKADGTQASCGHLRNCFGAGSRHEFESCLYVGMKSVLKKQKTAEPVVCGPPGDSAKAGFTPSEPP